MGLAASQARMLFLTARKNDIEFNEMKIANEKLALTRESEGLSDDYNRALNQRMLKFAVDGSATSTNTVDLTYGLLMTPNTTNQAGQYALTNLYGQVILSSSDATKYGLGDSGSAANFAAIYPAGKTGQEAWLAKCMGADAATADDYISNYKVGTTGSSSSSALGDSTVTDTTFYTNLNDDLNKISGVLPNGSQDQQLDGSSKATVLDSLNNMQSLISTQLTTSQNSMTTLLNGRTKVPSTDSDYKMYTTYKSEIDKLTQMSDLIQNYLIPAINNCGSGKYGNENWTAIAKTLMYGQGVGTYRSTDGSPDVDKAKDDLAGMGTQTVGMGGRTSSFANSLSSGVTSFKASSTPSTTTTKPTVKYADKQTQADFYLELFDLLSSSGWTTNSNITDKTYLQNQIINGNINIKTLNTDGSWSLLSSSDPASPIRNESDDDAVTLAESKYNSAKDKLDAKETELDLEMKNLDTERSEIDTEIDSVKNIISKNIERSFKMFA